MVVIQKKGSHRQIRIYFLVVAFEEKKDWIKGTSKGNSMALKDNRYT